MDACTVVTHPYGATVQKLRTCAIGVMFPLEASLRASGVHSTTRSKQQLGNPPWNSGKTGGNLSLHYSWGKGGEIILQGHGQHNRPIRGNEP